MNKCYLTWSLSKRLSSISHVQLSRQEVHILPEGGGGGGLLDHYLGMGEPLRVGDPDPV